MMTRDPHDLDNLDNHHPPCPGPCGQLADECMCNWKPPTVDELLFPVEHLCCKDLLIHDGPVEKCCDDLWRADGIEP